MSRVVSVDLGQQADYTALCVIERVQRLNPDFDPVEVLMSRERRRRRGMRGLEYTIPQELPPLYNIVHLERFELGTSYPAVVARVKRLIDSPKMQDQPLTLTLDATGVGTPVYDLFKQELGEMRNWPVLIHGGDREHFADTFYRVPKRELVSRAVKLMQRRELNVSPQLRYAETLIEELRNFRLKINITTGHDTYEAWRERDHDDLVLALCIGLWAAESKGSGQVMSIQRAIR
jgi:hypothetical protein